MNPSLPAFQQFQMAFGWRCRNPRAPRPAGVPARPMAIYEELLFANFTSFLDACFPVCHALLSDARWRRLCRAFMRDWRSKTPLFREIPREFIDFLRQATFPLPPWFRELAHYEWAELAVDTCKPPATAPASLGDLLLGQPLLNPTLMNLAYAWPVHRIGPGYRPRKPAATHLLVFRDADDAVKFVEVNRLTARLVELMLTHGDTASATIQRLADEVPGEVAVAVRRHGPGILEDLRRQGAIWGVRR